MIALHTLKFYCCNCYQKTEDRTSSKPTPESLVTGQPAPEPPMNPRARPVPDGSGMSGNAQAPTR
ncbi:hypothetical protein L873DRAFT_1809284 [Choiromyces venosus 120613-1]|uniref:Uncharacterized protein n=1 Tax=Choiromyces venosus 120613-1 TaxID=1336337 RepID=A0A3N4JLE8_9PEZI|nr:hypothetical protein L873DRAFT_1809284 [Choiromyces venosus 120613-1]